MSFAEPRQVRVVIHEEADAKCMTNLDQSSKTVIVNVEVKTSEMKCKLL